MRAMLGDNTRLTHWQSYCFSTHLSQGTLIFIKEGGGGRGRRWNFIDLNIIKELPLEFLSLSDNV